MNKKSNDFTAVLTKKIFIVDDNTYWREILKEMLSQLGYSDIHLFSNGFECLQNLHINPDLIFLDYQMEEENGIEVLKKIKSFSSQVSVIFCTGNEDLSIAMTAFQEGTQEYLLKENCTPKELGNMIKLALKLEEVQVK